MEVGRFAAPVDGRIRLGSVVGATLLAVACAGSTPRVADRPQPAIEVASPRTVPLETTTLEATPESGSDRIQPHVVSRGETLTSIARRYGATIKELIALNHLENPDALFVGQQLRVPVLPGVGNWRWPVPGGELISTFGTPRKTHRHQGLDIGGTHGQPVIAMRSGQVVYSGSSMRGYGKTLIVDHGEGFTSLYAHNSRLLVRKGDRVVGGQQVARVGRTGNASGEHCHVEIRRDDVPVDPLLYLGNDGVRR